MMQDQDRLSDENKQDRANESAAIVPPRNDGVADQLEQLDQQECNRGATPEAALEEKLDSAEAKVAELHDAFLRAKAELENVRRRTQQEVVRTHKFAIEGFAEALVPVKDSLETALMVNASSVESFKEGVEMTLKQLDAAFAKNGLTEINPAPGEKLDPMRHQAISMVPVEQSANTIINVLQKGYMIADRLLRPALVTVAQEMSGQRPA